MISWNKNCYYSVSFLLYSYSSARVVCSWCAQIKIFCRQLIALQPRVRNCRFEKFSIAVYVTSNNSKKRQEYQKYQRQSFMTAISLALNGFLNASWSWRIFRYLEDEEKDEGRLKITGCTICDTTVTQGIDGRPMEQKPKLTFRAISAVSKKMGNDLRLYLSPWYNDGDDVNMRFGLDADAAAAAALIIRCFR